jgi:hypothetical protein
MTAVRGHELLRAAREGRVGMREEKYNDWLPGLALVRDAIRDLGLVPFNTAFRDRLKLVFVSGGKISSR